MTKYKKNVNLLPKENLEESPFGKFLIWALTFGRYIIIFTELIVILAFIFRFKLDRDIQKVNTEVENKLAIVQSQQELEKNIRIIQGRYEQAQKIIAESNISTSILQELSKITPLDLIFVDISVKNNILSLTGLSLSKVGLATFIFGLTNSQLFDNVNISSVSSKENSNEISFSITSNLNFTNSTQ